MKEQNKELYWGVGLSYITTFVSLGVSLLLTPIIIRLLGQSDYGLYESIGSFVNYLAVLDFGFSAVVTRYTAKYQVEGNFDARDRFLYTCRNVYIILCLIILVIGIVLFFCIDSAFGESFNTTELEKAHYLFLIVLATTIVSIFSQVYKGVLNGLELFVWPRVIQLIKVIFSKVVSIVILYYGSDSVGFTGVMLAFEIISCLLVMYKANKHVIFKRNKMPYGQLKEIFIFSSYLFLIAIVSQIYWQVDKLILGMCMGTITVAIYSAALNIENIVRNVSSSLKEVLIPRATRIDPNERDFSSRTTSFMINSGRLIFIVYGFLLAGITAFGEKFIVLWLGPDYIEAYPILLILGYSTLLPTLIIPGEELCKTYNQHATLAWMYLFIAILNICLTFFLVDQIGMFGAAFATAIGLSIGNVIFSLLYFKKKISIVISKLISGLFDKLLMVLFSSVLLGFLINWFFVDISWITLFVEGLLFTILFIILLYLYGMNNNEKEIANKLISKIIKR